MVSTIGKIWCADTLSHESWRGCGYVKLLSSSSLYQTLLKETQDKWFYFIPIFHLDLESWKHIAWKIIFCFISHLICSQLLYSKNELQQFWLFYYRTVAMGQGSPPIETFSTMVIIVISLGVGIPVLMFLIGGIVIASRRCRQSSDQLLLN